MTNYIAFTLEDGSLAVLEVEEQLSQQSGGLEKIARKDSNPIYKATQSFEQSIEHAWQTAQTLLEKIKSVSDQPNEIEITFGLKASGELGGSFIFAKASAEGNYTVRIKWTNETPKNSA